PSCSSPLRHAPHYSTFLPYALVQRANRWRVPSKEQISNGGGGWREFSGRLAASTAPAANGRGLHHRWARESERHRGRRQPRWSEVGGPIEYRVERSGGTHARPQAGTAAQRPWWDVERMAGRGSTRSPRPDGRGLRMGGSLRWSATAVLVATLPLLFLALHEAA